jgi:hypothetical protein
MRTHTAAAKSARPGRPDIARRHDASQRAHAQLNIGNQAALRLLRQAAGSGPGAAPPIVHEVLSGQGLPLPAGARNDMEALLGQDFADVRIHTDARAGASAEAVAAHAYTVGRHIVFAPGRFDPGSAAGRRLLVHELTHAAGHPAGVATPAGALRISPPTDVAERHAAAVSEGSAAPTAVSAAPALFRQPARFIRLTNARVNAPRVTVPPEPGLSFSASTVPATASNVTFSLVAGSATIAAGTTIDPSTGAITVAAGQTGGGADAKAEQTEPSGATSFVTAAFNFIAVPGAISGTSATAITSATKYGGAFTHTFTSPAGGQAALDRAHVNEQFAAAAGTRLTMSSATKIDLSGPLGTLTGITVNDPDATAGRSGGWDLNAAGDMVGPDDVTWDKTPIDARPFVTNASNPTPTATLPQELNVTQNFRNLSFPSRTYSATPATSTTQRRAIEDRAGLKAVTGAGTQEIVQNYAGPTVFRNCTATPSSIPVRAPAPPGGRAPSPTTSTITVDAEGRRARPSFSIQGPALGCTISRGGVLTPGTTDGTVTVRAGDSTNFDETTVTITP